MINFNKLIKKAKLDKGLSLRLCFFGLCLLGLCACQSSTSKSASRHADYRSIHPADNLFKKGKPLVGIKQIETEKGKVTTKKLAKQLNFKAAQHYLLANSDKLIAAQSAWKASQLQAEALHAMNQPLVFINGSTGKYRISTDVSTAKLKGRLQQYGDKLSMQMGQLATHLPPNLAQLLSGLPSPSSLAEKVPSSVHIDKKDRFSRASVAALWPIYTGGKITAVQRFAHARADFKRGEIASTEEELLQLLIKRYFQVQLAEKVVDVRKKALTAVSGHDRAAKRLWEEGLISKVERLQATTAIADAKLQLDKAKNRAKLAQNALASLLQRPVVKPTTALFVGQKLTERLAHLQQKARINYPAFEKIAAKENQAKALKTLSNAAWHPDISAFGAHELSDDHKDWIIGLSAKWTLNSPIERRKMQQAADATLAQVNAVRRQAYSDVNLLVEKNYLAVNDAIDTYHSLEKEIQLAKQVVKLRVAGFHEGLNTVIELNDAEANLAKTRMEKAHAAFEYITALSELLSSTGELEKFSDYLFR